MHLTNALWDQYVAHLENEYKEKWRPLREDQAAHDALPFWQRFLQPSQIDKLLAVERHGYKVLPELEEPTVSGYFEWLKLKEVDVKN